MPHICEFQAYYLAAPTNMPVDNHFGGFDGTEWMLLKNKKPSTVLLVNVGQAKPRSTVPYPRPMDQPTTPMGLMGCGVLN